MTITEACAILGGTIGTLGLVGTGVAVVFKLGKILGKFEEISEDFKDSSNKITKAFELIHEHSERITVLETINELDIHKKESNGRKYI